LLVDAQIAQLVEQRIENPRVLGSIPSLGTIILKALNSNVRGFLVSDRATFTSFTAILCGFSIGIHAKRFTFYLQPQKVNKKGRSPNMFFIQ
jgi:hypothetical protein